MTEICRVCWNKNKVEQFMLTDIFDETVSLTAPKTLAEAIMECAPIQVLKNDGFPNFICSSCIDKLEVAHDFRQMCLSTDFKLRHEIYTTECNQDVKKELSTAENKITISQDKYVQTDSLETCDEQPDQEIECKNDKQAPAEKSYTCILCNNSYNSERGLYRHFSGHKSTEHENSSEIEENEDIGKNKKNVDNKIYFCTICELSFESGKDLSMHIGIHECTKYVKTEDESRFKLQIPTSCDDGSEFVNTPVALISNKMMLSCKFFQKECRTNRDRRMYLDKHAKPLNKIRRSMKGKHQCEICHKEFHCKSLLVKHERVHTGLRPFGCSFCGNKFKQMSHLVVHQRTHTGEKPYECPACDSRFNTGGQLKKHLNLYHDYIDNTAFQKNENSESAKRKHVIDSPLYCKICNKTFNSAVQLDIHFKKHTHELKETKTFKKISHLRVHRRIHTGERTYKCTMCEQEYNTIYELKKHQNIHHGGVFDQDSVSEDCQSSVPLDETNDGHSKYLTERISDNSLDSLDNVDNVITENLPEVVKESAIAAEVGSPYISFPCKLCPKKFYSLGQLKRHSVVHTGEKQYVCTFCNKAFNQPGHLQIHIRSHTGERAFQCSVCTKRFITKSDLRRHAVRHCQDQTALINTYKKPSGPFNCGECMKIFHSNTALENHRRTHSGERPFQCEYCGKGFKQKVHLTIHRKSHTGDKRYTCEICSKNYITNSALKKHMELHSNLPKKPRDVSQTVRSYYCEQCPKAFLAKHTLVKHRRSHTGETPFMCEICGKTFRQNAHLKVHIRLHTGEKPYNCDVCPKTFTTNTELNVHKVLHSDDLPHKCHLCDKRFKWKITAWRHMMYHTGERPNKCNMCDKGFVENGALRRHMRVHTGERPQRCEICSRTFKETTHLKTHMKIHNNT